MSRAKREKAWREPVYLFEVSDKPLGQLIGGKFGVVVACSKCGKPACVAEKFGASKRFVHAFRWDEKVDREGKRKRGNLRVVPARFCKVIV